MARTERLVVDLPAELVAAVRQEVAAGALAPRAKRSSCFYVAGSVPKGSESLKSRHCGHSLPRVSRMSMRVASWTPTRCMGNCVPASRLLPTGVNDQSGLYGQGAA